MKARAGAWPKLAALAISIVMIGAGVPLTATSAVAVTCPDSTVAAREAAKPGVDWSGCWLRYDLSGLDLTGANLRGADLGWAKLVGTILSSANLTGAELTYADLSGSNLSSAILACTTPGPPATGCARISQATLAGANFSGADLSGVDAGYVKNPCATPWPAPSGCVKLTGATLTGGNWGFSDLSGADLSGARLTCAPAAPEQRPDANCTRIQWATLDGANFLGADLTFAFLSNSSMRGVNLKDVVLDRVRMGRSDLTGSDLSGAVLTDADLRNIILTGADLRGATLVRAELGEAELTCVTPAAGGDPPSGCANLSGANLTEAVFEPVDLSGANLSRATMVGTFLAGSQLIGANLAGAQLTCTTPPTLETPGSGCVTLRGAVLTRANLTDADLTGANLMSTVLTAADLTRATLVKNHFEFGSFPTGNDATWTGATLSGWTVWGYCGTQEIFTGAVGSPLPPLLLMANWSWVQVDSQWALRIAVPCVVNFRANGGTGSMPDQASAVAAALTKNTFVRDGYTFAGWTTSMNGSGAAYGDQATFPFTSSRNLWANWVAGGSPDPTPDPGPGPGPGPAPTPTYPSSAPLSVLAAAGDSEAFVSWTAPSDEGSFPVTAYEVQSSPASGSCLATAPALSCTISGLTNGTAYTFTVRALNGAGWGAISAPSDPITPQAPVAASIQVVGSRDTGDLRYARITGTTTGLAGERVSAWMRFGREKQSRQGLTQPLVASDGTFRWSRKAARSFSVYFAHGTVTSNAVLIQPRQRSVRQSG
jgi:uncharacterized protein YjbI with pentapeptide repeats